MCRQGLGRWLSCLDVCVTVSFIVLFVDDFVLTVLRVGVSRHWLVSSVIRVCRTLVRVFDVSFLRRVCMVLRVVVSWFVLLGLGVDVAVLYLVSMRVSFCIGLDVVGPGLVAILGLGLFLESMLGVLGRIDSLLNWVPIKVVRVLSVVLVLGLLVYIRSMLLKCSLSLDSLVMSCVLIALELVAVPWVAMVVLRFASVVMRVVVGCVRSLRGRLMMNECLGLDGVVADVLLFIVLLFRILLFDVLLDFVLLFRRVVPVLRFWCVLVL